MIYLLLKKQYGNECSNSILKCDVCGHIIVYGQIVNETPASCLHAWLFGYTSSTFSMQVSEHLIRHQHWFIVENELVTGTLPYLHFTFHVWPKRDVFHFEWYRFRRFPFKPYSNIFSPWQSLIMHYKYKCVSVCVGVGAARQVDKSKLIIFQ